MSTITRRSFIQGAAAFGAVEPGESPRGSRPAVTGRNAAIFFRRASLQEIRTTIAYCCGPAVLTPQIYARK